MAFIAENHKNSSCYALDTFGSPRINEEGIRGKFGKAIDELVRAWDEQDKAKYDHLAAEIQCSVMQSYGFAYAKVSLITYSYHPSCHYLTVDVVEPRDQKRRMPFKKKPAGHYGDLGGLFKKWDEYMAAGFELMQKGELSKKDYYPCKQFHCVWGHLHPRLAPFEKLFEEGVAAHQLEIAQIFLDDSDADKRANAAFLLAYMTDLTQLMPILEQGFNDSDSTVRNNSLRVLVYIAQGHPEFSLPIEKVVAALDYPDTTDRNKAAAILFMVAQNPQTRLKYQAQLNQAIPILLEMLALKQKNNHDIAYQILKLLSGQDFGETNLLEWKKWAKCQPQAAD